MAKPKITARYFALSIMALIALDAWPVQKWNLRMKVPVARIMDLIGLRQGSWAMFTPNPVLNNRWISADMQTKDGQTVHWDSPLWSRATGWDKFVQFRHINYYNRIFQSWCMAGARDFIKYLFKTFDQPLESVQLHINRMDLIMPEDGSLPPRDEAEWRLVSEPWLNEPPRRLP